MALVPDFLNKGTPLKSSNALPKKKVGHIQNLQALHNNESLMLHAILYSWAAKQVSSERVLDIGCEYGFGSALAAESNPDLQIIGVDLNLTTLHYSRKNLFNKVIPLVNADANALPFSSEIFSGIFLINLLHLVEEPVRVLSEIRRLLKTGGVAFINVPIEEHGFNPETKSKNTMQLKLLINDFFSEVIYPNKIFGQLPFFQPKSFILDQFDAIWTVMCRK